MEIPLLNNPEFQNHLIEYGWASFPYLNSSEIQELKEFYHKSADRNNLGGFHATMFHEDVDYKKQVDEKLKKLISGQFNRFVHSDYQQLYANYMVKESSEASNMKWHQDWSYVHENKYNSYAIWIPLDDINEKNGAFTVAEGSHQLSNYVRGPGVNDQFVQEEWIKKNYAIKPLYLKAGEAVVWHHRLLHASPPNFASSPRIAITAILTPKDAENIYFYQGNNDKFVREYSVDNSFYLKNKINSIPNAKLNKKFFYQFNPNSNEQKFEKFILKNRIKRHFLS